MNKLRILVLLICSFWAQLGFGKEVWIDVRSVLEHQYDHITGDLHLPIAQFSEAVGTWSYAKEDTFYLYCAAGVRAEKAKRLLLELGYKNVRNVGGIGDARALKRKQ